MPYKEKKIEKLYFTVGEVARKFDVSPSLVRYWEKEFDLLKPKKSKKGNRKFTRKDVEHFQLIYHLIKERGFTLEGAKLKLRRNKEDTVNHFKLRQSLLKLRDFLVSIRESL